MVNPCPDGQVLDKVTKECRPPLKRGRKTGKAKTRAKKPMSGWAGSRQDHKGMQAPLEARKNCQTGFKKSQ